MGIQHVISLFHMLKIFDKGAHFQIPFAQLYEQNISS